MQNNNRFHTEWAVGGGYLKEGRVEEAVERMTAGEQGAQLFNQELVSKGRKQPLLPTVAHLNTHIPTETPLSFNDALRA